MKCGLEARTAGAFLAWSPLASGFLADGFDLAALTSGDLRHRLGARTPAEASQIPAFQPIPPDIAAAAAAACLRAQGK